MDKEVGLECGGYPLTSFDAYIAVVAGEAPLAETFVIVP